VQDAGSETAAARAPSLVAIGNFDGVHRGHQAVLAHAAGTAAQAGLRAVALTFDPHPAVTLGRPPPPLLTRLDRKRELVRRVSPSLELVTATFDAAFAAQSPETFAQRVLFAGLGARAVVVGRNFRFGKARAGDYATLSKLGDGLGFTTSSAPLVGDAAGAWSSTRVREAIAAGDVVEAERILGRPHMVSGDVVAGDRRGRTIGFPTCNLGGVAEALPAFGVYAVLVDRVASDGVARALAKGVANVGVRPSVEAAGAPKVEAHLFDLDADLYGARLRVHLAARIRPERAFSGLDALKAQIAEDAANARELLRDAAPDPDAGGAWR
jgi:riboflavin kinase/FMN adenylyltransferase